MDEQLVVSAPSVSIFSTYPLSVGYKKALEETLRKLHAEDSPSFQYVTATELRQVPTLRLLPHLRSIKPKQLIIAVEEESGIPALPILQLISMTVSCSDRRIAMADTSLTSFRRIAGLFALMGLAWSTLVAWVSVGLCRLQVSRLLKTDRIELPATSSTDLFYLNANLWFGVKAGGSVGHISGVVNAFSDRGYDVDFASFGGKLTVSDDVNFLPLPAPKGFGLPFDFNRYVFHRLVVKDILPKVRESKPGLIYQRLALANYAGVLLSRKERIPLIVEYNGSEVWISKNWGRPVRYAKLAEEVEEVVLKHAHLVVTISAPLRDELLERGVEAERIVLYPNCVNPDVFDPVRYSPAECTALREANRVPAGATVVTFVGTFGQWHGVDFLAKAIRRFCEEGREEDKDVFFLIVGDGIKADEVRQILSAPACEGRYRLTGLVPQLEAPRYLAASDILVSPHVPNEDGSSFFGSPTKLFEYLAMGKAIIASRLDQIGEVMAHSLDATQLDQAAGMTSTDKIGVLFEPLDEDGFLAAIRFLHRERLIRDQLGANARAEALTNYTWARHVEEIVKAAESVKVIETTRQTESEPATS